MCSNPRVRYREIFQAQKVSRLLFASPQAWKTPKKTLESRLKILLGCSMSTPPRSKSLICPSSSINCLSFTMTHSTKTSESPIRTNL